MTYFLIWDILKPAVEISILWVVFYRMLAFFEGTRAFQVLKGLTYLLVAFLFFQVLGLDTLNWLLTKLFAISIIALLVIFQQELRQGLARLGQQHLFTVSLAEAELLNIIDQLTTAVFRMSKQNHGSLIAIEREVKLNTYIESGVTIDAKVSTEILQSIFNPDSPLHDGGAIVRHDRIVAVSCLFPLSENPTFSKTIGTRHRAALGLSEQTDAIVVMVSEETGTVSVVVNGQFIPILNKERIDEILRDYLVTKPKKKDEKNSRS